MIQHSRVWVGLGLEIPSIYIMPHLVQGRLNWQWKLNKQSPKTLELLPLEVTKALDEVTAYWRSFVTGWKIAWAYQQHFTEWENQAFFCHLLQLRIFLLLCKWSVIVIWVLYNWICYDKKIFGVFSIHVLFHVKFCVSKGINMFCKLSLLFKSALKMTT